MSCEAFPKIDQSARMFTVGGGTAQILRTLVAADILQMKLLQMRDGYVRAGQSLTRETD